MRTFLFQTKTNSRRALRSGRQIRIPALITVVAFVGLYFFRGALGEVGSALFTPLLSMREKVFASSEKLPAYTRSKEDLTSEIESLADALKATEGDAFAIRELRKENQALKALLGLKEELRIVASVIARPSHTPYDTFLLDRGYADGIQEGAVVYAGESVAVGTIIKTYKHGSLARLVSSPGVKVTAYVYGAHVFTEAEGVGGGVLRVAIPQGVPLSVGDMVVLPGIGAGAYGEIVGVESSEESPEQYGYVAGPIPLRSMRYVNVGREIPPSISYDEALEAVRTARSTLFSVPIPEEARKAASTATSSMSSGE